MIVKSIIKAVRGVLNLPYKLMNWVILRLNRVRYGPKLRIHGLVKVYSRGKITLGRDVIINSSRKANPIGGQTRTSFLVKRNGRISIGDRVGISNTAFVAFESITVEDEVFIGAGCKIYDTDFHSLAYEDRILKGDQQIKTSPVLIKKGAFIGAHSIILKGVTVGEKSIIGAGSVVTGNIPDGEVWAGNPARYIKKVAR